MQGKKWDVERMAKGEKGCCGLARGRLWVDFFGWKGRGEGGRKERIGQEQSN